MIAPPNVKILFWLYLHSRFGTIEQKHRHNLQDDDRCVLWEKGIETTGHMLDNYIFSRELSLWSFMMSSGHVGAIDGCLVSALVIGLPRAIFSRELLLRSFLMSNWLCRCRWRIFNRYAGGWTIESILALKSCRSSTTSLSSSLGLFGMNAIRDSLQVSPNRRSRFYVSF